jgi:hypothetical protein
LRPEVVGLAELRQSFDILYVVERVQTERLAKLLGVRTDPVGFDGWVDPDAFGKAVK